MTDPVAIPIAAEPVPPPPRPIAWFVQAPARTLGPLTRDELLGYFGAGLVVREATIIGPEWDGSFSAAAAAEWFGVALRAPGADVPRDPASLPPLRPAPLPFRRAGLGWRLAGLWLVVLLAVQMAIVPAGGIAGKPYLGDFVVAAAWRFALVAAPCFVVVAGLQRLVRGVWPSALGALLMATAVYVVLALQFALHPAPPAPVIATALPAPAADAVVATEDPAAAWLRAEAARFAAQAQAEQAEAATPTTPESTVAPAATVAGTAPVRRVPVDADPWQTRARALHASGDWNGLRDHATQWSRDQPRRYEPWQFLGIAQYELQQRDAAVASFERALAAGSSDPSTLRALAGAYADVQRWREAAETSQRILDDEPDSTYALAIQGRAMSALGEYDEAVAALEHAIRLRPRNRYYYGLLADIRFRGGFPDRGRAAVQQANDLL
jgi:tetratricopeptide (TPR) repeat protein